MGRREDPLVAQQVQKAPDPVGGEEKELRRDDTLRVRVDNLASGRTIREVIFSGLALKSGIGFWPAKIRPRSAHQDACYDYYD